MNPEVFRQTTRNQREEFPLNDSTPESRFGEDHGKQPLKLYGPLKINRLDVTWGGPTKTGNKWTYFQDKDNRWNNPDWAKAPKILEHYHDDKMRRDCMSMDRLMRKSIIEEKKKFNTHKNFIDNSHRGKLNRLSDRVRERVALQKDSDQAILDHQEQYIIEPIDDEPQTIQKKKQLVLTRSHLLNSLDKSHSNLWNNYKAMDKKHIDQTVIPLSLIIQFTNSVIKGEEKAINRIGTLIEEEKVTSITITPRMLHMPNQ